MIAYLVPTDTTDAAPAWLQIVLTLIGTLGVSSAAIAAIIAMVRSGKGVKAAEVAAGVAAQTQESNSADHGRVANALGELRKEMLAGFSAMHDEVKHLSGRIDDVAHNTGAARDQLIIHQQWHMDHPPPPNREPPT